MTLANDAIQTLPSANPKAIQVLVISWILLVPLLFFASSGNFWFQNEGANNVLASQYGVLATYSQGGLGQTVQVAILLFVSVLCLRACKSISSLLRKNIIFGVLAGLAMISSLWSQDPGRSLHWGLVLAIDTIFVFYLHQRLGHERKLQFLLMAGWACLLLSIFLVLFVPTSGIDHTVATPSWRGMYGQKNMCAMATVFWLSVGFYVPARSVVARMARGAYVCLSIGLIAMTRSVTSYVILGCLIFFVIVTQVIQRFESRSRIAGLLIAMICLLIVGSIAVSNWTQLTYLCGKDPTLTGRSGIWQAAWESLVKHPIFGYGYRAFWAGYEGESANVALANGWAVPSAHNAFLEVWLDLGAVGLSAVLYALLKSVRGTILCLCGQASAYRGWCACIVFLTIAMSIDEGEMMIPNGLLWMLFILASVGIADKR